MFKWGKYSEGYEVSLSGDSRFAEDNAVLAGGRTILEVYNCDVKGYCPGGTNWKLGYNKAPVDRTVDLWEEYLGLWREWALLNPNLLEELRVLASFHDCSLNCKTATDNINAARALTTILNEKYYHHTPVRYGAEVRNSAFH